MWTTGGSNALVATDTFVGVTASFAHSTFDNPIGPGTYRIAITGNAVRDTVFDLSLSFAAVPEPATGLLVMAGLAALGVRARRGAKAA